MNHAAIAARFIAIRYADLPEELRPHDFAHALVSDLLQAIADTGHTCRHCDRCSNHHSQLDNVLGIKS